MTVGRLLAAALALLLTAATAQAGDATAVAERGGFLLGHALRCGIAEKRLEPSARLVHDLVVALAASADEADEADRTFAARMVASAEPAKGDPVPSCALIRRKLALFERHQPLKPAAAASTAPPAALDAVLREPYSTR